MNGDMLICVDCYEGLQQVMAGHLAMYYCKNIKCRRFGVLTVGGLLESSCEKKLEIQCDEGL